jgi:hypothetical protein
VSHVVALTPFLTPAPAHVPCSNATPTLDPTWTLPVQSFYAAGALCPRGKEHAYSTHRFPNPSPSRRHRESPPPRAILRRDPQPGPTTLTVARSSYRGSLAPLPKTRHPSNTQSVTVTYRCSGRELTQTTLNPILRSGVLAFWCSGVLVFESPGVPVFPNQVSSMRMRLETWHSLQLLQQRSPSSLLR